MEKKKKLLLAVGIGFLLFIAAFFLLGQRLAFKDLNQVLSWDTKNDTCYGLVKGFKKDTCFLIKEDLEENKTSGLLLSLRRNDGTSYIAGSVAAAGDNQAAIHVYVYEKDVCTGQEIWLCDMKKKTVSTVFTKAGAPKMNSQIEVFSCEDGILLVEFLNGLLRDDETTDYLVRRTVFTGGDLSDKKTLPYLVIHITTAASYSVSESNGLWYTDRFGNVYHCQEDGNLVQVFENNGEEVSVNNVGITPTENGICFYNLDDKTDYLVTDGEGLKKLDWPWLDTLRGQGYQTVNIFQGAGGDGAVLQADGESAVIALAGPDGRAVITDGFQIPYSFWIGYVILAAAFASLTAAAASAAALYIYRHVRIIPVTLKILAVMIPVLAVCGTCILIEGRAVFYESHLNTGMTVLYNTAATEANEIDKSRFQAGQTDVSYFENRSIQRLAWTLQVDGKSKEETGELNLPVEYGYFKVDGPEVYPILDVNYVTTPAKYELEKTEFTILEMCLKEENSSYGICSRSGEEYLAMYTPVFSETGDILGAVACSLPTEFFMDRAKEDAVSLSLRIIAGFSLILAAVMVLLYASFLPLKELKNFFTDMTESREREILKVRGRNEISELLSIFARMSENIREYLAKVMALQEKYQPFVPVELVTLMGKEDIRSVNAGDQTKTDAALLIVSLDSFDELKSGDQTEVLFKRINDALEVMIPYIREAGGLIVRFDRGGLIALFPKQPAQAASCILKILSGLQEKKELSCHGALDYRRVTLEIMGCEERMDFTIRHEDWEDLFALADVSKKRDLGVIATDEFMEEAGKAPDCPDSRLLGTVMRTRNGQPLIVHELLNRNETEQYHLKLETLELFNEGVGRFMMGQPGKGREAFVKILKINHRDTAARRYFNLCDQNRLYFEEI